MLKTQKIKLTILICMFLMLCIVAGLLIYRDHRYCMNVMMIKEDTLRDYTEDPSLDISALLFNGERVAADRESNTIYISQPADTFLHSSELIGTLESADPDISLYFIKNSAIKDIPASVHKGEPLSLAMVNAEHFRRINVIITSLPVLRLEQLTLHQDESGQDIMTGNYTLWGSSTSSVEEYSLISGTTQWHIRGRSSTHLPKKSWKLSLKNVNGENQNQDLLGLGADDDWILNSMNRDDTKVREKFTMDLWNGHIADPLDEYPMSKGQYIELVINNEYRGLYLLMRRVDSKYLELDQQTDILLKGISTLTADTLPEGYEIISSPYSDEKTYAILQSVLESKEAAPIQLKHFIKTNLFVNYCVAVDNTGYSNMFFVLRPFGSNYTMYFVPWDMDLTMGVFWNGGSVYDYSETIHQILKRMEYQQMKKYDLQLDQITANLWNAYRDNLFTEATIEKLLSDNIDSICKSGAYDRDLQKWGCLYNGTDTHSGLHQWCMERLSELDSYYSQIIN